MSVHQLAPTPTLEALRRSSLREWWDELAVFDFSADTSDDPEVHRAYRDELERKRSKARMLGPDYQAMLNEFEHYHGLKNRWWGTLAAFEAAHNLPARPE